MNSNCTSEHWKERQQEREDCEIDYDTMVKEQKKTELTPGVIKMKDFSIRLTPLKDIPTTLKPHHSGNTGNDDIDGVIYCEDCDKSYHGDCPVHGPLIPLDESRGWDQDSKSFTSVPVPLQVTVKMSSIMNAGKGVFVKEFIPRRTRIGPYKGEVVQKEDVTDETDTSYFWEVKKNGSESYYIDAKNEEHASWLRFINCARNEEEQNLLSFQYQGNIYCYTIKDILPGTELLVWYGEQYVKLLGLPVEHIIDAKYTCAHCQSQFVEKYNFNIHLKYSQACHDANPQVFKCGKCGEVFTTLINLQQHIRRHEINGHSISQIQTTNSPAGGSHKNTREEPLQCQYCSKSFRFKSQLKRHLLTHTGEMPHQCQHSKRSFALKCALKMHLRTHTGEKSYQCQYCRKSFAGCSNLRAHLKVHTMGKHYQCHYCKKMFSRSLHLQHHLATHTGEKPHQCQFCKKAFAQRSTLKRYLRTHTGEKPYHCQRCEKRFTNHSGLQSHLRTHTGEKQYQCQYCNKAFSRSDTLKCHLTTHIGEKLYHCQFCKKAFAYNSTLKVHLRTHTGEKPYQCQCCRKAFADYSNLRAHFALHTIGMHYQCHCCMKMFSRSLHLQHHLATHTEEKPHHCQFCKKTFAQKSGLRRHVRTHTGEKPYHCQHCPKTFTNHSGLQCHLRTHTGEKPYQCQYCNKTFSRSHHLNCHLITHINAKPYKYQE